MINMVVLALLGFLLGMVIMYVAFIGIVDEVIDEINETRRGEK